MVNDFTEPIDTLGQRLNRQATRLMSAHTPTFGWLAAMQELLDHLASLPAPIAGRFDRIEAGASVADFHAVVMPARTTSDDDGEPTTGRQLPSDIHAQVRRVIGRDASPMRVHDDRAADTLARAHRADAVTFGRDVYFRQGRLRPRDPDGFGLIAHEATHVAELFAPGGAWRRLTGSAQHDEERLAETNERRASIDSRGHAAPMPVPAQRLGRPQTGVVGFVAVTPPPGQPVASSPPAVPGEAPAPALQPMLAADDRTAAEPASVDMEALRRSVFDDLKRQLRTEFERERDVQPGNQLARASIVDTTTGDTVSVMYNPEEMKLEQGNNFAEIGIPGLNASPVQYVRGKSRTLSMELFFDSYESGQDVRIHTNRIVRLLQKRPETQAPSVLIFVIGGFAFRCVLVDAGQRFTMFRSDGTPVRSFLSIRLQEYVSVSTDIQRGLFFGSPTVSAAVNTAAEVGRAVMSGSATVHITGLGDTLQGLAGALLGDPALWRDIAEANSIDDPFNLVPGMRLMIPPRPV